MGFLSEHFPVNHLYNTFSSCANLGCFTVRGIRQSFVILLDAIKDHNRSFCFFSHRVDDTMLYGAIPYCSLHHFPAS